MIYGDIKTAKTIIMIVIIALCFSGCDSEPHNNEMIVQNMPDGSCSEDDVDNKEDFKILTQNMEKENPYLQQTKLEQQLKRRLNEYIFYEGGISYEAPLMVYEGEILDYIVFHKKEWDSQETDFKREEAFILLQPRNKESFTSLVEFTIYNDSMYSISLMGHLDEKIDFGNTEDIQKNFEKLFGSLLENKTPNIWYTGTLTVGEVETLDYVEFKEKKEQLSEINSWINEYLQKSEIVGNMKIYVRNYNEDDSNTDILIENEESKSSYLLLTYYFYQENNFQTAMDIQEEQFSNFIAKIKKMSTVIWNVK